MNNDNFSVEFQIIDNQTLICDTQRYDIQLYRGLFYWYNGESYDINNNIWYDLSGNNNNILPINFLRYNSRCYTI